MPKTAAIKESQTIELKRQWGWILLLGILFLFLGFIGLGMVISLTLMSMFFLASFLIVAGIIHFIDFIEHKKWKGILGHVLISVLYITSGCLIFNYPLYTSSFIALLLAVSFITIGITRIIMAIILKEDKAWGWLFLTGISAVILGLLMLIQWPDSGLWIIGMFIAIELIVNGWTYVLIALFLRKS